MRCFRTGCCRPSKENLFAHQASKSFRQVLVADIDSDADSKIHPET